MADDSWPHTPADLRAGDEFVSRNTPHQGIRMIRHIRESRKDGGFWITSHVGRQEMLYKYGEQIRIVSRA